MEFPFTWQNNLNFVQCQSSIFFSLKIFILSILLILLPRAAAELTPSPPNTPLRRRSAQDMILRRNIRVHDRLKVRLDKIINCPKPQTDLVFTKYG